MAQSRWRILIIDDDEDDYILIREMLNRVERINCEVCWAPTYTEGMQALSDNELSAVLVDYDLGMNNGLNLIREAVSSGVEAPLIMVTGRGRYEVDLEAMDAGAVDYLTKAELTSPGLERAIRYAIREKNREEELEQRVRERTQDLQEANENLQNSLEEVRVLEEELLQRNDEIAESYKGMESQFGHLQVLFENAPGALVVTDDYGKIKEANQNARLLLNLNGKETHKLLPVFISPLEKPSFYHLLGSLREARSGFKTQLFHIKTGDGELVICRLSVTAHTELDKLTFLWLIQPNGDEATSSSRPSNP